MYNLNIKARNLNCRNEKEHLYAKKITVKPSVIR